MVHAASKLTVDTNSGNGIYTSCRTKKERGRHDGTPDFVLFARMHHDYWLYKNCLLVRTTTEREYSWSYYNMNWMRWWLWCNDAMMLWCMLAMMHHGIEESPVASARSHISPIIYMVLVEKKLFLFCARKHCLCHVACCIAFVIAASPLSNVANWYLSNFACFFHYYYFKADENYR